MSTAPWDIYAEQLTHLGYGYPLWIPDPAPGAPPVEIGDVGWINEGEFISLFNVFRGENEAQPRGAVPVDHVPLLTRDCTIVGPRDKISQSVLYSQSIRKVDVSGEISATAPSSKVSCAVNFNFECTDEAGALLVLGPTGRTLDILSKRRIMDYMDTHFDRWLEFANDRLGLGLREDQLMFVSGTTKTSSWGVAAFRGATREKRGSVVGNLGPLAAADFSMSISDAQLSTSHYRAGPTSRTPGSCGWDASRNEYDQCVFIHYYKRKRRKWPLFPSVIKAAAGAHQLPRDPDDDMDGEDQIMDVNDCESNSSGEAFERFPQPARMKDPAEHVLEYILENTIATAAIASDTDFFVLQGGLEVPMTLNPDYMSTFLSSIKPPIMINENGYAALSESCTPQSYAGDAPLMLPGTALLEEHGRISFSRARSPRDGDYERRLPKQKKDECSTTGAFKWPTSTPKIATAPALGCGLSYLQSMSSNSPSSSTFGGAFKSILSGRKCYRILKKNEVVWSPLLEAALMEGIAQYTPFNSETSRGLTRFTSRNKFVADYILSEKTGQIRTAKQVGSRIQQLRGTSIGNDIMSQISDRHYKMMHPDMERSGPAPATSPPETPPVVPQIRNAVDVYFHTPSKCPTRTDSLPRLYDSMVETDQEHKLRFAHLLREVDPTVMFKAHSALPILSRCTVYYTGRVVNVAPPTTMALTIVDDGTDVVYQHSTRLAPTYWDILCELEDPSRYTIVQELWPYGKSPTAGDPAMMTVNYHFTPASPTSGPQGEPLPLLIEPEMTSSYAKSSNEEPPLSPERDHSVIDHSFSFDQSLTGDTLREKSMSIPVEDDPVIRKPGIDDPAGIRGADYDGLSKDFRWNV